MSPSLRDFVSKAVEHDRILFGDLRRLQRDIGDLTRQRRRSYDAFGREEPLEPLPPAAPLSPLISLPPPLSPEREPP